MCVCDTGVCVLEREIVCVCDTGVCVLERERDRHTDILKVKK